MTAPPPDRTCEALRGLRKVLASKLTREKIRSVGQCVNQQKQNREDGRRWEGRGDRLGAIPDGRAPVNTHTRPSLLQSPGPGESMFHWQTWARKAGALHEGGAEAALWGEPSGGHQVNESH